MTQPPMPEPRQRIGPFRRSDVLGAAAGVLYALCWTFPVLSPLIPLWFVVLFEAMRPLGSAREFVRLGVVAGAARFLVGAHFLLALTAFSPLGVLIYLSAVLYVTPLAAGGAWLAFTLERRTGIRRELAVVFIYPFAERLRATGPVSLPADITAHAFGGQTSFLAWSSVIGPFGLTLLSGLAAYLLWQGRCESMPARRAAFAAGALALWIGVPVTGLFRAPAETSSQPFRVAIVQPSFALEQKLDPRFANEVWATLEELSTRGTKGMDLVLWGETIRPGPVFWREGTPFHDEKVEAIARKAGVPILYGCEIARVDAGGRRVKALYNGAALARPDGSPGKWYGKQQLVPFAEGVPYADLIGYDPAKKTAGERSWISMAGNFSVGPRLEVFDVGPARISVLICYEGLYPGLARRFRLAGANVLAVLVNDAWWGKTMFPEWHARIPAVRALENGMPVLRAGNDGVSCAVGAAGARSAVSRRGDVTTMDVQVAPATGPPTFYAVHGDWVLGLDFAALLVTSALAWLRRPATVQDVAIETGETGDGLS